MQIKATWHGIALLFMGWLCIHSGYVHAASAKAWIDISATYWAIDPEDPRPPDARVIPAQGWLKGDFSMGGGSNDCLSIDTCEILEGVGYSLDPFCPYFRQDCIAVSFSTVGPIESVGYNVSYDRWELVATGSPDPESFSARIYPWNLNYEAGYIVLGANTHIRIEYSLHMEASGGWVDSWIGGVGQASFSLPLGWSKMPETMRLTLDGTGVIDRSFVADVVNHSDYDVYWPWYVSLSLRGSTTPPIPEPSSYLLALAGLIVLAVLRRRLPR